MPPAVAVQDPGWLPVPAWLAAVFTVAGYLVTLLLVRWVLLLKKDSPPATVAWLMAIVFIPYVGGLLFLVFGINRVDRRAALKRAGDDRIDRLTPALNEHRVVPGEFGQEPDRTIMALTAAVGRFGPVGGNEVEVLADTNRAMGLITRDIERAERSVHLEYYLWKPDRTGTKLRDLLIEKAKAGVRVRLCYDGIGSLFLSRRWLAPLVEAGGEVAEFLPGRTLRERWSLNLRNHRKIVVVDGRVGFCGGMNVGDEYLGYAGPPWPVRWAGRLPGREAKTERGFWRDTHLRVEGPAVAQLQQVFAEDWYFASGRVLADRGDDPAPGGPLFPRPETPGRAVVQTVPTGPVGGSAAGGADVPRVLPNLFLTAVTTARHSLDLTTGYFVPPQPVTEALEAAAWRGVRVRLLVPGTGGKPWTIFAGRSDYAPLLRAGAEIHEFTAGTLHAKTLTVDGTWSLVGSANLDARSFHLNFEAGLLLYDDPTARSLSAAFDADLARAIRVDPAAWADRPSWRVLAENFCRMFAPIF